MSSLSAIKVGVFVDCPNIYRNGGNRLDYSVLRELACRDGADAMRLAAYVNYDAKRGRNDHEYRRKTEGFHNALRDLEYRVVLKEIKWYQDDVGNTIGKANVDMEMAIDVMSFSENLDRVLLVTGDQDFVPVVHFLQSKGCRVEVMAFDNVSHDLRQKADTFISGYLIPELLPQPPDAPVWGEVDSTVRGWCYYYDHNKGFGYMRYLNYINNGLWMLDKRRYEDSPYETAYFQGEKLPENLVQRLPSRDHIMEFRLTPSERNPEKMVAEDIKLVCTY